MHHFIGTVWNKGAIVEYILAEYSAGGLFQVYRVPVYLGIQSYKAKNLWVDENGSVETVGNIRNYMVVETTNGIETKHANIVIMRIIEANGSKKYAIYNSERGLFIIDERSAVEYLKKNGGAANVKIVKDSYIASLRGSLEEFDKRDKCRGMYKDGERVTPEGFREYLAENGIECVSNGNEIDVMIPVDGVQLKVLKIPESTGKTYRFNGGALRIKELIYYGNEGAVVFYSRAIVDEFIIDSDSRKGNFGGSSIKGNIVINKIYNTPRVQEIYDFSVEGVERINMVRLSGERLSVSKFFDTPKFKNGVEIRAIDLSEMGNKSNINDSFNRLSGQAVVKLGDTSHYANVFRGTSTRLVNFFGPAVEVIHGFDTIQGLKIADFEECVRICSIKIMDGEEIEQVKMPLKTRGGAVIRESFNNANVSKLVVKDGGHRVEIVDSFRKLREIEIRTREEFTMGAEGHRKKEILDVFINMPNGEVRMPTIRGYKYRVRVADGVEKVNLRYSTGGLVRIDMPKSVREIDKLSVKDFGEAKLLMPMNLGDTSVEELPDGIFKWVTWESPVYKIPRNIRVVGKDALQFKDEETHVYIPSSVEKLHKAALNCRIVYLEKGSKVRDSIPDDIYIVDIEDEKEFFNEMSDGEKAKLELVIGDKSKYKDWENTSSLRERIPELIKLDQEIDQPLNPYKVGIELNRAKFVDLTGSALGLLWECIVEAVESSSQMRYVGDIDRTTDQFNILSNILTANTENYIPAFSKVPIIGRAHKEKVKSTIRVMYWDGKSFIVTLPLWKFGVMDVEYNAYGIVIVENGRVKFATPVDYSGDFLSYSINSLEVNLGTGLCSRVVIGDGIDSHGDIITAGLMNLPRKMQKQKNIWRINATISVDMETARLIEFSPCINGVSFIMSIKEYGEYEVKDILNPDRLRNGEIIESYRKG